MKPMNPADLEQDEHDKIYHFLQSHPIGVLATVDQNGDPHASTIYYSVDENLNISFTTKKDTVKYTNLLKHPRAMLGIYDAGSQTAVQISGEAKQVHDEEEAQKIYHGTLHAAKVTGEDNVPPVAKIMGVYISFTIKTDNVHFSEYGWGNNLLNAIKHSNEHTTTEDPA